MKESYKENQACLRRGFGRQAGVGRGRPATGDVGVLERCVR